MNKLFKEYGIIGKLYKDITPSLALKVGKIFAYYLKEIGHGSGKILISEDTRESSPHLRQAISSGIISFGLDVEYIGKRSIPSLIQSIKGKGSSGGIYISGMDEPSSFNGITLFDSLGKALNSEEQSRLEELEENTLFIDKKRVSIGKIGKYFESDSSEIYSSFLSEYISKERVDIERFKIVIDFANGPSKEIKSILTNLNFNFIALNDKPDGKNINHNSGLKDIRSLQRGVIESKAVCGLSLNSTGSKMLLIDEKGQRISSDKVAAILSINSSTKNNSLVLTGLSSLIIEDFLKSQNIQIFKALTNEKDILSKIDSNSCNMGASSDGTIIFKELGYCDPFITLIKVLKTLQKSKKSLSELNIEIPEAFQIRMSVPVQDKHNLLFVDKISIFKQKMEPKLFNNERIDIQLSKSNEIVNILAEGKDKKRAFDIAYMASNFIKSEMNKEEKRR